MKALFNSVTPEKHWHYLISMCDFLPREVIPACLHEGGKEANRELCVIDLKGFR